LSKGDLSEEEVWCHDNIGDDHIGLKIGFGKSHKLQSAADNGVEVGHERAEPAAQNLPFGVLAAEQRHLLAVFAQSRQRGSTDDGCLCSYEDSRDRDDGRRQSDGSHFTLKA
jgi:hypothetical protein